MYRLPAEHSPEADCIAAQGCAIAELCPAGFSGSLEPEIKAGYRRMNLKGAHGVDEECMAVDAHIVASLRLPLR